MAQFFKPSKSRKVSSALRQQQVIGLDHHLQGVVRHGKQVYFVPDALPGESIDILPQGSSHQAKLLKRHSDSTQRISAQCPHYQLCGGCSAQHLSAEQQLEYKAEGVVNLLEKMAGYRYEASPLLLADKAWHYRRSARLSSWYSVDQGWQLGFRQKSSKNLVAIDRCDVLLAALSDLLPSLQSLVAKWPKNVGLGHVDLLQVDQQLAARFRLTKPLGNKRKKALDTWALEQNVQLCLSDDEQPTLLPLHYQLAEQQLNLGFNLGDFIQINAQLNQQMIQLALTWLDLTPSDTVLDLYAGMGNFSLPVAQHCKQVIAVEGVARMAEQITTNASANGLTNVEAVSGDLEQDATWLHLSGKGINKVLLDPARAGAKHAITQVAKLSPSTVVYVSCNPATLARDAVVLKQAGYLLKQLAVVDMFSQTEHVETMAVFTQS